MATKRRIKYTSGDIYEFNESAYINSKSISEVLCKLEKKQGKRKTAPADASSMLNYFSGMKVTKNSF